MAGISKPIYLLGLGSIGSFIAHSLRSIAHPPPVTLLIHRADLYKQLSSRKLGLRIGEDGPLDEQSGFDAELLSGTPSSCTDPIHHLIVTVKAPATVTALQPYKHRIGRETTICFFQNGLGQLDELNERLFTDPSTRPRYMCGIARHGVYLRSATEAILSGPNGSAAVGFLESRDSDSDTGTTPSQDRFLIDTLLRSPRLRCTELNSLDLLHVQLLKLASNCLINPLTALLDVRNGELLHNTQTWPTQRRLLSEISHVFGGIPAIQTLSRRGFDFSATSLESVVRDTVGQTALNSSSMREDVRKGRATEIEYLNGWIIKRGKELGIDCAFNQCLTQMILAKNNQGAGSS
ncbi:ketopantoate reductase PanE/ApbA C terminal-domain-containing protein [Aspergillus californicus]